MTAIWSELAPFTTPNPAFDCAVYPIEDQQVLSVVGPDSKKFMQGQFTCHLDDISTAQFRLGACCNAKGRMVSSFNLLQHSDGHYLLGLDRSLTDTLLNHLKKYKVFFKTQMQITDYIVAGIQGPDATGMLASVLPKVPENEFAQVTTDEYLLIKLPHNAGFQLWLDPTHANKTLKALLSKCTLSNNNLWNKNLIQHGIGHVSAPTSEAFIPQMINLNQNGGVSFSKGCYTGQEIVARMQYLGKLKRHMYRVSLAAGITFNVGDEVFVSEQKNPVGIVVSHITEDNQQQALVVIEDKVLPNIPEGAIYIGKNNAVIQALLALPYDPVNEIAQ